MSAGKVAVQVAHASSEIFFKEIHMKVVDANEGETPLVYLEDAAWDFMQWRNEGMTKILKEVKNESQLLAAYKKAEEAELPCALITDLGLTELEDENNTCVAIGPAPFDEIQKITKRFRLYQ